MYKVFCDGASRSNPGEAAIGVSIQDNEKEIHTISEAIGIASNNVAEYKSLIFALEYSLKKNYLNLEIFLDSKLVVEQINGNFKVKSDNLKKLNSDAINLISKFNSVIISHIYREHNKRADQLANMALDK
ncbi:MAG: ribonuclease HI family protein [Candidatus Actinomarina sp.]|jgi:ribonuclease HI|tara:strand:- start:2636 stop:3025 length:390 start_codon:yes stop_codon:yes gene_type:complete